MGLNAWAWGLPSAEVGQTLCCVRMCTRPMSNQRAAVGLLLGRSPLSTQSAGGLQVPPAVWLRGSCIYPGLAKVLWNCSSCQPPKLAQGCTFGSALGTLVRSTLEPSAQLASPGVWCLLGTVIPCWSLARGHRV